MCGIDYCQNWPLLECEILTPDTISPNNYVSDLHNEQYSFGEFWPHGSSCRKLVIWSYEFWHTSEKVFVSLMKTHFTPHNHFITDTHFSRKLVLVLYLNTFHTYEYIFIIIQIILFLISKTLFIYFWFL